MFTSEELGAIRNFLGEVQVSIKVRELLGQSGSVSQHKLFWDISQRVVDEHNKLVKAEAEAKKEKECPPEPK